MQKKTTTIILILIIIALGIWVLNRGEEATPEPTQTNGTFLQEDNGTPIMHLDVEYYPGAKGYFVRPQEEEEYPGIILIHENRGLRPEIKIMADMLAKNGYQVLAVDLLGTPVETQEEAKALTAKFDQKKAIENMKAAITFLQEEGAVKIASLGWCFGGAQSLQLALSGVKLDATALYYGKLATTTTALAPIKWPVLGIFGDKDQSISVESVKQFEAALDELKIENEIHIYPDVGHAFANPSGMNYAPGPTKDAWAKTVAFLNKHLK